VIFFAGQGSEAASAWKWVRVWRKAWWDRRQPRDSRLTRWSSEPQWHERKRGIIQAFSFAPWRLRVITGSQYRRRLAHAKAPRWGEKLRSRPGALSKMHPPQGTQQLEG